MNAERLHAIANAILADLKKTNTVSLLEQLRGSLQNQVNQPQHAAYQQQVSETLKQLNEVLTNAKSNSFTPVWRQCIEEIGASGLLGEQLRDTIKAVFAQNQITPSVALEEIAKIHGHAQKLSTALEQLHTSLKQLKIGAEELDPGQCELGLLIPRTSIKNKLEAFSSELHILNKTFGTFSELASGSRPGFNIRTISSTDLTVFLDLSPEVCACAAIAIERIVALYKQLLEIRELRARLAEKGLNDKSLQGVDSHANTHMKDGIDILIGELIERYAAKHDEGRRNELRTELRQALNRIANRVDHGFNFEVRVEPLKKTDEKAGTTEETNQSDPVHIALNASRNIQFLKPGGKAILSLPEPDDEDKEK